MSQLVLNGINTICNNFDNPNLAKYPWGAASRRPYGTVDGFGLSKLFQMVAN